MTLCPQCHKNEAGYKQFLGIILCSECRKSSGKLSKQIEFTSQNIKDERKQFAKDLIAPFREGHVSKEFIETYGTKRIDVSPNEVKTAINVWPELSYYKD